MVWLAVAAEKDLLVLMEIHQQTVAAVAQVRLG
jgi:hypothetical protein